MISETYQLVVLSKNYFLWLGLKHAIPFMVSPNPMLQWFNKDNDDSVFQLSEKILHDNSQTKWLVVTEDKRVQEVQQLLPSERACVFSDKLPLKTLNQQIKSPIFRRSLKKEPSLTHSEIHICSLVIMGFSPNTIARMLHKSPKTIYTHRRNAMAKFHCNTLADLHRKIRTMNDRSFNK